MRFLTAGEDGLLVELAGLGQALALLDRLRDAPPPGLVDLVPAARTVLLRFDPFLTTPARLRTHVAGLDLTPGPARAGQVHEIPVAYDGEDLAEVAALLGWPVAELIRRHTGAVYTVAFTGFAPGFAYMTCDDPALDVPRRASPRVRIPAGSVALAGPFGGIYPADSPGGWQLLGRTPMRMWDLSRARPAVLAPGDRVRFRDMARGTAVSVPAPPAPEAPRDDGPADLVVLRADRPALFQDAGRPGQAAQGVARSGALDRGALRAVNDALGNPPDTPALELILGGLTLRAEVPLVLALTGAPCPLRLCGGAALPHGRAFALDAGDVLEIGTPTRGMVSYLGLRGGYRVAPVLGSAARDTLARVGPDPVTEGARLRAAHAPAGAVDPDPPAAPPLPAAGECVVIDILPGPRDDWFTPDGLARLTGQDWLVTPEASRTGKRLAAPLPVTRRDDAELPSEATVPGAIQIPHSGQPVLFLADHPLTGGYPVAATVARHHLDLAAQVPPGALIRFRPLYEG